MTARAFVVAACLLTAWMPIAGQGGGRAFNVFLDCSGFFCDETFVRTEIVSVNWVRERTAADVHILATTQPTGGGGTRYSVAFIGQHRFEGVIDTLTYDAPQASTDDETRRSLSRVFQAGLVRYLARTKAIDRLVVSYTPAQATDTSAAPTRDPWNAWVFSVSANANDSREESYSSLYASGRVSASRVTEEWKTLLSGGENYNESRYSFDGSQSIFIQRSYSADLLQVKSLGANWSAGVKGAFTSSTYLNQRAAGRVTAVAEYDLFPYADATRRQLRFQYGIGASAFSYYDTTTTSLKLAKCNAQTCEGPGDRIFADGFD
ncbi:MAG: hypothetical protein ABI625_08680 [bacterium]